MCMKFGMSAKSFTLSSDESCFSAHVQNESDTSATVIFRDIKIKKKSFPVEEFFVELMNYRSCESEHSV